LKVILAKTAGFCMGVRRAMEKVLAEANKGKGPISTYGPLIHNTQVMELLEAKGVTTVEDISDLESGTLVIRAHGIPPDQRAQLKASGLQLIDATCPRVARVQAIIRYHTKKGYMPVIVGDKDHPEVIGLLGYGNGQAWVINQVSEVETLPQAEKVCVVAQTTQDEENYIEIQNAIKRRFSNTLVFDTICDATHSRQGEVRSFAGQVDGVVVVGGYHSGNTQRIVQVSKSVGLPTIHVETEKELTDEMLSNMQTVAVTAGASTPNWMIKNVVKEIETIFSRRESFFERWMRRLFKALLLCNVLVALGAFALCYAATILSGGKPDLIHPTLAFLYVYAMYVMNRFLDKGASTYNDPERANFYRKYRIWLILTGIGSILGALGLSYFLGIPVFLAMAGLIILGILYSIPIVPTARRRLWRYARIKDIPGSKTLSEALAWGVVITLLPLIKPGETHWYQTITAFLFVVSMVYVVSGLFDILQVQGDRIVGAETLPITLGEKRTMWLLKGVIIFGALVLITAPLFGPVGLFSYLLLFCFLSLYLSLLTYEKRWLYPGNRLEAFVNGNFFFAGFLGLIWHLLR
jgi:4-hydroxy-3-methylbut-2-enyl diphosphate reductase